MTRFIEARSRCSGVEPICRELQVAPPSYDAASRHRPLSARRVRDEALNVESAAVPSEYFRVYGARKLWRQLQREGISVARCTVERLMRELSLSGVGARESQTDDRGGRERSQTGGPGGT